MTNENSTNSPLPKKLYKFRMVSPTNLKHTSRILTHNELYFPNITQLNDPWECRPLVRTSAERWTVLIGDTFHSVPPSRLGMKRRPWEKEVESEIPEETIQSISEQVGKPHSAFKDLYHDNPTLRLCSFAANCMHPLLWSHYADSHRGLCVEFDTDYGHFATAQRVKYQKEYPILSEHYNLPEREVAAIMYKSDVWEYEDEYRLITGDRNKREQSFLDEDHVYRFPPEALTGIIFGCQMSDENKSLVKSWLTGRKSSVEIRHARLHKNRYELVFEP